MRWKTLLIALRAPRILWSLVSSVHRVSMKKLKRRLRWCELCRSLQDSVFTMVRLPCLIHLQNTSFMFALHRFGLWGDWPEVSCIDLHACRLQSLGKECGVKGNKGVYLIKDEEHGPIYTQWRYEAVCLLLLQTILVFANNRGLLRRMPSGCMCLLRAKLQVGVKPLCVWSSLLHKTKQNNSTDKQHRERENFWHAWSHSDTSVSGTCSIFKNKCAGRVPGGELVATHPFSPVPVAVPVAVLVCHVCQPLPAPYSFSSLLLSEPACPLSDGTRCPWCYYPRTLPGRARGEVPTYYCDF